MRRRRVLRIVGIAAAVLVVLAALFLADIAIYAERSDSRPADAAIVLGAAVIDGQPSPVFEERLRHAALLYRAGAVPRLVLTGGIGGGDAISEAEAGRNWLLAQGVPSAAILIETSSRTTEENLGNARAALGSTPVGRVLIVSDPLHERRAVTIARDLGLDAYPSPTPTSRYTSWGSRTRFLLREGYFYALYLIAGPRSG